MKKSLLMILSMLMMMGCNNSGNSSQNNKISIIVPEGTPALALANFYSDNKDEYSTFDIKNGSDPLIAAFTSKTYDVIVAPTNLGAKMYSANDDYVLYETIVWGNLYLASLEDLSSLKDIENKEVTLFSKNSTPDIVLRALIAENNLENVSLKYVDDVTTANSSLLSEQAKIIVSAQPSLTALQRKKTINTIDLQEEWKKIADSSSYPQASVFVKKSLGNKVDGILKHIKESVLNAVSDPVKTATKALEISASFKNLGQDVLASAIPMCHYGIDEKQKEAIEYYFTKMSNLGLSAAFGGELPENAFYYHY